MTATTTAPPPADQAEPPVKRASKRRPEPVPAVDVSPPTVPVSPEPKIVSPAPQVVTQEPLLGNSPFHRYDVVQVLDTTSRQFGQFFVVGDAHRGRVHGYYLMDPGTLLVRRVSQDPIEGPDVRKMAERRTIMNKALIYDIEIIKAVPVKNEPIIEGIDYCAGWHDHANMGISVIGCYDYATDRYRVFCNDNFKEFASLLYERAPVVSFNGVGFDNKVLAARGLISKTIETNYDILRELWIADGIGPEFSYPTHTGYGLEATCTVNFSLKKSGDGGLAPVNWQRGNIGSVIDYCLDDVRLTKRLFERIKNTGGLRSPKDSSRFLEMRKP
jgi:hypothetical protein